MWRFCRGLLGSVTAAPIDVAGAAGEGSGLPVLAAAGSSARFAVLSMLPRVPLEGFSPSDAARAVGCLLFAWSWCHDGSLLPHRPSALEDTFHMGFLIHS